VSLLIFQEFSNDKFNLYMSKYQYITYETKSQTAYITLNRPEKRNALNGTLVAELTDALWRAKINKQLRVVVLKASGTAFCAGADLEYLQSLQTNTFDENLADSTALKSMFQAIYEHPLIVIAQVHGHAIAGGAGLAAVCDFVFAVPEAKFGFTEVGIGFIPALVSIFLLRKSGETKAKELLLTGKLITAEEAKEYGIVNFIEPEVSLSKVVNEFAEQLCKTTSKQAVSLTKSLINKVQGLDYLSALSYAAKQNAEARATEDCQKGIAAFLNKAKPDWKPDETT